METPVRHSIRFFLRFIGRAMYENEQKQATQKNLFILNSLCPLLTIENDSFEIEYGRLILHINLIIRW